MPNARIWLEAYINRDEPFDERHYCRYKPALNFHAPIDYVNYIAYMDSHHRHMFDDENLVAITAAGFRNPSIRKFDPEVDLEERAFESRYAVARK